MLTSSVFLCLFDLVIINCNIYATLVITPASIHAAVTMATAAQSLTPYRVAAKAVFSNFSVFLSDILDWVWSRANSQHDPTLQSSSVEISSNSTSSIVVDDSS